MPKHLLLFINLSIILMFIKCSPPLIRHVNVKPTETESVSEEISESSDKRIIIRNRIPGDKSNETKTEQSGDRCFCGIPGVESEMSTEISGGKEAPPHGFPWAVRITGGTCVSGFCGGSLISPRHILTSYHCTYNSRSGNGDKPCDHSDGKRVAVLGQHEFERYKTSSYYTIPIIDVKYPPKQKLTEKNYASHDLALGILKEPAVFSRTVRPICLPQQNAEFVDKIATAAGWGRFETPDVSRQQSPYLKKVELRVSKTRFKHWKMFGTVLRKLKGYYQDPCAGDSGGPLMYYNPYAKRFYLIGTLYGSGYDCKRDSVLKFEGSDDGLWNKVSVHVNWIKKTVRELDTRCV